ncbi:MAG: hypothetical protein RLZZ117_2143, partial [Cyanobacteriota bacterium]
MGDHCPTCFQFTLVGSSCKRSPPLILMDGNGVHPPDGFPIRPGSGDLSRGGDDTNVVRVAFGVRRARRTRPVRPDHWATLVLPLQAGGG